MMKKRNHRKDASEALRKMNVGRARQMGMTELQGLPKYPNIEAELQRTREQFASFIGDIIMGRVKRS